MSAPAQPSPSKADRIVQTALEILRDEGHDGLSMRGVAGRLGMSLSNVQYYFRGRDTLLLAVVEHYIAVCSAEVAALTADATGPVSTRRRALLGMSLRHGHEMTEMCRLFREIWAISTRDPRVEEAMSAYYAGYAPVLAAALLPAGAPPALVRRVGLLVVPYVEGYSITGRALAEHPDEAVDLLVEIIERLAEA